MRRIVLSMKHNTIAAVNSVLLSALFVFAPLLPGSDPDISPKIEEYMETQVKANGFRGSILVAQNGKVILAKGYGMARAESSVPNTTATKYRLGPTLYSFIAVAVLELEQAGKIDVNDLACKYLAQCPDHWAEIKIVNLLTHTSGISEFPGEEKTVLTSAEFRQLLGRYKSEPLEFKPGERAKVSNFSYVVLGAVIEKVSGMPLTEYLEAHIFVPLAMRETGYDDEKAVVAGCASGYRPVGDKVSLVADTCLSASSPRGAGGAYSTVEDLYRWDRAFHDGKLVSKSSGDEIFVPFREGYGFGWKVLKEFQRKVAVSAGRSRGFSNSIRRYLDDDVCVIVLSNIESIEADRISHDLGAIVFGAHYQRSGEPHPN